MSGVKKRIVYWGLILFTLWPLAHLGLVRGFGVNPWKLAGWGMYSAPQFPAEVRVLCHTPDAVGTYELRTIRPELEPVQIALLRRRLGLGRLARPDRFAAAILDHYPAIDGVTLVVLQPVMNPRTGMIEEETTTYEYRRSPL